MAVISDKQWRDLRISEKREPAVCGWSDFFIVKTTRLAGGLLCPYKGLFPACARKAH